MFSKSYAADLLFFCGAKVKSAYCLTNTGIWNTENGEFCQHSTGPPVYRNSPHGSEVGL